MIFPPQNLHTPVDDVSQAAKALQQKNIVTEDFKRATDIVDELDDISRIVDEGTEDLAQGDRKSIIPPSEASMKDQEESKANDSVKIEFYTRDEEEEEVVFL